MSPSGTERARPLVVPLAALTLLALTACSDPEEPVADRPEAPALIATVEAVAGEVHDALGVADDVEVLGVRTEACTDATGRDDGRVQAVLASRLADSGLTGDRLDDAAEALGATDIRTSDLEDPLDPEATPGRQVTLFARRDGARIDVTLRLEDDELTATYRTNCQDPT